VIKLTVNNKPYNKRQHQAPTSVRCWDDQLQQIDWAAKRLGISRSRLFRSAALQIASELRAGAERPVRVAQ
jgi:hypothetical protein